MNDLTMLLENTVRAEKDNYQYCSFLVKMLGAFYNDG